MKKGQLQISFSMLFSIIVIIAILGVSFYVITFFLNLDTCGDVGFFYRDLDLEIEKAWKSQIYSGKFEGDVPSSVDRVCFGDLNSVGSDFSEEREFLSKYRRAEKNVFLYPDAKGCDIGMSTYNVEHAEIDGFWCVDAVKGKVTVKLEKDGGDALVKLSAT